MTAGTSSRQTNPHPNPNPNPPVTQRTLALCDSSTAPLSQHDQSPLTPPSLVLPQTAPRCCHRRPLPQRTTTVMRMTVETRRPNPNTAVMRLAQCIGREAEPRGCIGGGGGGGGAARAIGGGAVPLELSRLVSDRDDHRVPPSGGMRLPARRGAPSSAHRVPAPILMTARRPACPRRPGRTDCARRANRSTSPDGLRTRRISAVHTPIRIPVRRSRSHRFAASRSPPLHPSPSSRRSCQPHRRFSS